MSSESTDEEASGGVLKATDSATNTADSAAHNLHHPRASKQTWVHSCCNDAKLKAALRNDAITAIEADIVYVNDQPIMAHPPKRTSDLTFRSFLDQTLSAPQVKHLKLDFKELRAVEPCLAMLAERAAELTTRRQAIWLNADVIPGPNTRRRGANLRPQDFLPLCRRMAPFAFYSLGWSTAPLGPDEAYTAHDCEEMERLCAEYELPGERVVFAASLRLAERNLQPLLTLLQSVPESQLLFFTATGEPPVWSETVNHVCAAFGADGASSRIGFDARIAQSVTHSAQAHVVDCSFFCSRWCRWLCFCRSCRQHRLQLSHSELQPLVSRRSQPPGNLSPNEPLPAHPGEVV